LGPSTSIGLADDNLGADLVLAGIALQQEESIMLRIVRFETRRDLKLEDIPKLFSRARAMAGEIQKVRGIAWCKFYFNGLEIIFAAEGKGYVAADRVDASLVAKKGVGQLFEEFGYAPTKDEFLRDSLEQFRMGRERRGRRSRKSRAQRR
jgi:hypothetical protein